MPKLTVHLKLVRPASTQEREAVLARLFDRSHIRTSGCWEYQLGRNGRGYAQLSFQNTRWMAHRLMWVLNSGPIPPGMFVCHRCDNPPCVNPAHLFLGDHTQNQRDMIAKNRHSKGSQTHCKRGHPLSGDNVGAWRDGHRECVACQRGRVRIKAGWPEDIAYSLPATPKGERPFGKDWKVTKSTVTGGK